MRFSLKIFMVSILCVVISFTIGGYLLITSSFSTSLKREQEAALAAAGMLRLSCESMLVALDTGTMPFVQLGREVSRTLFSTSVAGDIMARVWDDDLSLVYKKGDISLGNNMLASLSTDQQAYAVREVEGVYYIHNACAVSAGSNGYLYLETFTDITTLFNQRFEQFALFGQITLAMVVVVGALVYFAAWWVTKPINELSRATRSIAGGLYNQRAEVRGHDEIGVLATDFNLMAQEVEHRVQALEEASARQQDFVSSFAHELKTPLTSMIGYADMLRSKNLTPEDHFLAANYIFAEGKRLESLSLKLLDLFVMQKSDFEMRRISATRLFAQIEGFLAPIIDVRSVRFEVMAEEALLVGDADLLKTLFINLLDNARKAIDGAGAIQLLGRHEAGGYAVFVSDSGKGIPEKDLPKITEAFYMVDKSRARRSGGAGLGLSICAQIVEIHGGSIDFRSELGKGTSVRVMLHLANEA